jgi:hypothetical protein
MDSNYCDEEKEITQNAEHQGTIRKPDYYYRTAGIVGTASFSVVLPKQYAINLGVGRGDFLKVSQQQDKIIIEKA